MSVVILPFLLAFGAGIRFLIQRNDTRKSEKDERVRREKAEDEARETIKTLQRERDQDAQRITALKAENDALRSALTAATIRAAEATIAPRETSEQPE